MGEGGGFTSRVGPADIMCLGVYNRVLIMNGVPACEREKTGRMQPLAQERIPWGYQVILTPDCSPSLGSECRGQLGEPPCVVRGFGGADSGP
uniref:Uncharacterized protein n=1 Tax=Knipowitschia caucasica TaxID=637954 RepID=A0AAV2LXM7_KNICA